MGDDHRCRRRDHYGAGSNSAGALFQIHDDGAVTPFFDHATLGGNAGALYKLGQQVIFSTWSSTSDFGSLWLTNGTPGGTHPFEIDAGDDVVGERVLGSDGTRAFFNVLHTDGTRSLWSTDGTTAGTRQIIANNTAGFGVVGSINGRTLVLRGEELWSSDGTAAGTQRLLDHYDPGSGLGFVDGNNGFVRYLNAVYFANTDPTHGTELWRTDGTVSGTRLYADVAPGADSSVPRPYGVIGTHMLFGTGTQWRNGPAIFSLTNIAPAGPPTEQAGAPGRVSSTQRAAFAPVRLIRDELLELSAAEDEAALC